LYFVIIEVNTIEQQFDVEPYQHVITVEVEQKKDKYQKLDCNNYKNWHLYNL